jgi:hypothetical protein
MHSAGNSSIVPAQPRPCRTDGTDRPPLTGVAVVLPIRAARPAPSASAPLEQGELVSEPPQVLAGGNPSAFMSPTRAVTRPDSPRAVTRARSSSTKGGYPSTARRLPGVSPARTSVCAPPPHPTSRIDGEGGSSGSTRRKASAVAASVPGPFRSTRWWNCKKNWNARSFMSADTYPIPLAQRRPIPTGSKIG